MNVQNKADTLKNRFNYFNLIVVIFLAGNVIFFLIYLNDNDNRFYNDLIFPALIIFQLLVFAARKRPLITYAEIRQDEELIVYILNGMDNQIIEKIALKSIYRIKVQPKGFWYLQDVIWIHTTKGVFRYYSSYIGFQEFILPALPTEKR
jgi:hypothetical protein